MRACLPVSPEPLVSLTAREKMAGLREMDGVNGGLGNGSEGPGHDAGLVQEEKEEGEGSG